MTYLKVGDGVYVNGEINPYNLGGWPFGPRIDPVQECAANAAKIARNPVEPSVDGYELEPTLRDLVQSDAWRRKMEALPPPKLQPAITVTKVSGPGNVPIRTLQQAWAANAESATDLVNRVAAEQREGKA